MSGDGGYGDWIEPDGKAGGQTTQRPAVLAIGPAGENLSRMACLIHDAGNGAGQGGFGAVWGSKRLKTISVIGTGSIRISNPKALMQTRLWQHKHYAFSLDNLKRKYQSVDFQSPPLPGTMYRWGKPTVGKRPQACIGCGACVEACSYIPARLMVVRDDKFENESKDRKCNLCANAPYHWEPNGGGPRGKQACVEVCPVGAIKFTTKVPKQEGDSGYKVNLRDSAWFDLGYPKE